MSPEMKNIYREFLCWQATAVELKITSRMLYLLTLDRAIEQWKMPREKTQSWEVLTKLPL